MSQREATAISQREATAISQREATAISQREATPMRQAKPTTTTYAKPLFEEQAGLDFVKETWEHFNTGRWCLGCSSCHGCRG